MKKIIKKFKPHTIKSIEKERIENQKELGKIELERENKIMKGDDTYILLEHEIASIKEFNKILDLKRQHKLDRRNGWASKFVWSILVPIIVALCVSFLINTLIKIDK